MALEAVAEGMLAAVVLPFFREGIRHPVVMDRKEEIGPQLVGARGPIEEPARWRRGGDQLDGLAESGIHQHLLDLVREAEVEPIFGRAAGAQHPVPVDGVAHVDDDAECRAVAARGTRSERGSAGGLTRRRIQSAARKQDRHERHRHDPPPIAHRTRLDRMAVLRRPPEPASP